MRKVYVGLLLLAGCTTAADRQRDADREFLLRASEQIRVRDSIAAAAQVRDSLARNRPKP
jgi:hypothetical protein